MRTSPRLFRTVLILFGVYLVLQLGAIFLDGADQTVRYFERRNAPVGTPEDYADAARIVKRSIKGYEPVIWDGCDLTLTEAFIMIGDLGGGELVEELARDPGESELSVEMALTLVQAWHKRGWDEYPTR